MYFSRAKQLDTVFTEDGSAEELFKALAEKPHKRSYKRNASSSNRQLGLARDNSRVRPITPPSDLIGKAPEVGVPHHDQLPW
mmetsp:Transcript_62444/g.173047  ORF Transcript_62444/g.173047 Transcript_62444/m.173047 type:complete len:82 (+) Transcript_62444:1-246(+)